MIAISRWTLLALLLLAGPVRAQDVPAALDDLFSWATPETPGCAVAVAHQGEVVASRAYGLARLDGAVPITPSTRFDIGSVQKQFVAAAVLLLVDDGRIALDDDVRTYIPELAVEGHTITVDHLLTHTSGVRDWTALLQFAREKDDALSLIARQRGLNFAPGDAWSYSNSGYVLLKELIARVTGVPFSAFAAERLFEPLGMTRTLYADDVRTVDDRALAYEERGGNWQLDILIGHERGDGGALLSTADDLLRWNAALTDGTLGSFVTETLQAPAILNDGRALGYARGLFLDDNDAGTVVWHTGSAAAYKAMLARMPEQDLSFAVLCNAGDSEHRSANANAIVDLFVPNARPDDTDAAQPDAVAADVSGKTGVFFSQTNGQPLHLTPHRNGLRIDGLGGGVVLETLAEDHFRNAQPRLSFMSEDAFELHFRSDDAFDLVSASGAITRYRRVSPYTTTDEALEAFGGHYESAELDAALDVTAGPGGLAVRLNGRGPFGFEPVAPDVFRMSRMWLRFHRDAAGKVVALSYSNPVLTDVQFIRGGDAGQHR